MAVDASLPPSWGRGNITADAVHRYRQTLAACQGLGVAYSQGNHSYTESEMDTYAARFAQAVGRGPA